MSTEHDPLAEIYAVCAGALNEAAIRPLERIEIAALRYACGLPEPVLPANNPQLNLT